MKIYHLSDPRDYSIRYVGVTSQILAYRLKSHVSKRFDGTPKAEWIRELFDLGLRPIITQIVEVELSEANASEARWIAHFRRQGWSILNVDGAPPGFAGAVLSDEQRRAASQWRSAAPYYCKDPAAKSRKLSELAKGRKKSPEHVEKVAAQKRGKSRLPAATQEQIRQLFADGMSRAAIARRVGCSPMAVEYITDGPPRVRRYGGWKIHNAL